MRIAVPLLGLCIAATAACSSNGKRSEPAATPPSHPSAPQASQAQEEPATTGDYARQQAEQLSLAEQKKQFLVDQHLQHASELKERLELEQAEQELAKALQLAPDNPEAKSMLAEVGALLGRAPGETQTTIQELENKARLKKDQLEIDARQKVDKAKLAISRGDFDSALVELTLAQDQIRWSPYSGDWSALEQEVEALIASTRQEKVRIEEANRAAAQREAQQALRSKEQDDQSRRSQVIASLLDQAITAFQKQ